MFIKEIKNCEACGLRSDINQLLADKKVNNYQTFCHYYSKEDANKAKFLFIMQNPLLPKNWVNEPEFQQLGNISSDKDAIKTYRAGLMTWLKDKNKKFFSEFIASLNKYKVHNYSIEDDDFDNKFLADFIVTDLVKCRASTPDTNQYVNSCFNQYLKRELDEIGRDKLIFVFSSRTWDALYATYFKGTTEYKDYNKIVKAHGRLFYNTTLNSSFIPLAHFTGQQLSGYLRESYFDYFKEGLDEYYVNRKKDQNH